MSSVITPSTQPESAAGRAPLPAPSDGQYAPGLGLARGLGWFSIGLGMAELLAPGAVGRLTGVRSEGLLQAYGLREIACGVGILSSPRPAGWLWGRVAGDALDAAALLSAAARGDAEQRGRALWSLAVASGITLLDVLCAGQMTTAVALEG